MNTFPELLIRFGNYQSYVNRSPKTIAEYRLDLAMFLRYLVLSRAHETINDETLASCDISCVDAAFLSSVTPEEIYAFLSYVGKERENRAAARARKLSAIRSFYKYLTVTLAVVPKNPAEKIDSPRVRQALPKHLTLDESVELLDSVENSIPRRAGDDVIHVRDFAIITLFLNCGMRLSELVGINMTDIDPKQEQMRVIGKGAKERVIYLNDACRDALLAYIAVRQKPVAADKNALFLSRLNKRISCRTVQWLVDKYLADAGLAYKNFSAHKLRHTAATLMYQEGGVDVRVLKDILGHEQLNTTQIYTHVSDAQMREAMKKNPLAKGKK